MAAPTPPGWYPDPTGIPVQRYWDGVQWTATSAPAVPAVQGPAYAQPGHGAPIITGPNHVLHAILSLCTFWACGGWLWVWLIIAISNRKHVTPVDQYGYPTR